MSSYFDRYQQGLHQKVYDELLALHENVFDDFVYEDALLVARGIMRRVRHNIEILIPCLSSLNYQFGTGKFYPRSRCGT